MVYDFNKIIENFDLSGKLISCEPYGEGHINQTFLATVLDGDKKVDYIITQERIIKI